MPISPISLLVTVAGICLLGDHVVLPAYGGSFDESHNYPSALPPTDSNVMPAGDLKFSGPLVNTANFVFGSQRAGSTVRSRADLDRYFDYNLIYGNQDLSIGQDGLDGLYANFRSRMRHYRDGDPDGVHVIGLDSLILRGHCAGPRHEDCSDGHIYSGMIRPYIEYLPGTIIEVCYRMPSANWSWSVPWLAGGSQVIHPPGESVYRHGVNGPDSVLHFQKFYAEIDLNDGFPRLREGVPVGHAVTSVTPFYNPRDKVKEVPHLVYLADGDGYRAHPGAGPPFVETLADLASRPHCNTLNWRGDRSHLLDIMLDGKTIATHYMEYNGDVYTDSSGVLRTVPMHLIVADQIGAKFAPDIAAITDQGAGWDMEVVSIRSWLGYAVMPPRAGHNGLSGG